MRRTPLVTLTGALGFALALLAQGAAAAMLPVAQSRSVAAHASATVFGVTDSNADSAAAADFAPFVASVDPSAFTAAEQQLAFAQGVGDQNSSLGPGTIAASGAASVAILLLSGANSSATAIGDSQFEYLFTVDRPSTFLLTGQVDTQAIVTGGAAIPALLNSLSFEYVDNSSTLFQTLTGDESFSVSGQLQPGSYRLSASARTSAAQTSSVNGARTVDGSSSYGFTLEVAAVPEPAVPALLLAGLAALAFNVRPRTAATARTRER